MNRERNLPLGRAIEIVTRLIGLYRMKILEKTDLSDLSDRQLSYLDAIFHLENPTLTVLAQRLAVSKPSASVIVERLTEKGFVERVRSTDDGRAYFLRLTRHGRKCARLHDSIHSRFALKVRKVLDGRELDQLALLLNKIIDRLG